MSIPMMIMAGVLVYIWIGASFWRRAEDVATRIISKGEVVIHVAAWPIFLMEGIYGILLMIWGVIRLVVAAWRGAVQEFKK